MLGLYVHVPFCSAICNYCNFNRGLFDAALKDRYVDALVAEIAEAGSQAQDGQARSSFPGMYSYNTGLGAPAARNLTTDRILSAENHWQGGNYLGWSNPEFDRLTLAYGVTLDPSQRAQVLASMAKLYSEELPAVSLFFRTQAWVFPSSVSGPHMAPPEGTIPWNIYQWELK